MAKTNLTEEKKRIIAEALRNNSAPPPELMTKLFQRLFYPLLMLNADKCHRTAIHLVHSVILHF